MHNLSVQTKTPLDDAMLFLKPLQQFASDAVATHAAAFEVYQRKNRPMLCLQATKRARAIDVSQLPPCFAHCAALSFALPSHPLFLPVLADGCCV